MLVEMLGGIWISDKKILNNTGFIQDKNISGIVNCIKDLDFLNKNYAVLLGGSLTKVPQNAFPKEMLFEQSQWFTVNYQQASQVIFDVFKNYNKYLVKSKQLQLYTKNTYNLEKMKYKLDDIVSKILSDVPKEVGLKLPKLKKTGESQV